MGFIMKRFLSLLFLSVFVVFWAGCQKEPNNPIGSEYTEEDGGGGSQTEMIYYEIPGSTDPTDCTPYVTDLVFNNDLSDWDGSESEIIGSMTVTHDATDLIFTFKLNPPYDGIYYIKSAVGAGWVVKAFNGRYVPPGIRNATETFGGQQTEYVVKVPKDEIKYIGPKKKDYSFYCDDLLGLAGTAEVCTIASLGGVPAFPDNGMKVKMKIQYNWSPISYFKTNINDGPDLQGWCIDIGNTISNGTYYDVEYWSSYTPLIDLPAFIKTQINDESELDEVNWIINNFTAGVTNTPYGIVTWQDIQAAIWKVLGEGTHSSANGDFDRTKYIYDQAKLYGEGFKPDCNGKIAMILGKAGMQITIVVKDFDEEFPQFCTYQGQDCQTAWAFGNKRYCLQIPGFPGRYWYWVTTGYKWCCIP
jgi:hypothetical protein